MPALARNLLVGFLVISPALVYAQSPDAAVQEPFPNFRQQSHQTKDEPPARVGFGPARLLEQQAAQSAPMPRDSHNLRASYTGENEPTVEQEIGKKTLPLARREPEKAIPLSKPSIGETASSGRSSSIATLLGSLAVVVGVFLLAAWLLKRSLPRGSQNLPSGVVEVLGRAPLTARQFVHLVRCGNKLLLISITPSGMETLTEITDPVEVDRLAGVCQQSKPSSATAVFHQVFSDFASEPVSKSFAGTQMAAGGTTGISRRPKGREGLDG